jgi:hypothetical protein
MPDRFYVARAALHRSATHFEAAAKNWRDSEGQLNYANIGPDDLGLIGRMANIPAQYNQTVREVWAELNKGSSSLNQVATTLEIVSESYKRTEKATVQEILKTKKDFKGVPPAAD